MSDRTAPSRRTVCTMIGTLVATIPAAAAVSAQSSGEGSTRDRTTVEQRDTGRRIGVVDDVPDGAERYVAAVDRIVDGEHVVLLLEDDDRVVDQVVVSVDEFDEIDEGDLLIVVVKDGELLAYRHIDERPDTVRSSDYQKCG
ncbi:hypothetical protein [Natrarchaeobaculum sulfurireducens]|uniref:Uncharacterized protein n=1 Tax=Natrarchaeobaculum sulfurireducens TaxID=2044521 RepID=A0A346PIM2_9EURY|nr:hypothetical protein [Natrarchaeobaculum sulfurireducens]AXR79367.1 hypothetical protein AArc1_3060 [Natrarchaeobaculum sulfurireducens]